MKKLAASLLALGFLSACQTTGNLRPGEVMGTDIGSILIDRSGAPVSSKAAEDKMNIEIDKALYFSPNGLTTQWYAGFDARMRPLASVTNRRDRDCRRFRHGVMIDGNWHNGTAVACRENNVAWYLISNQWDRQPDDVRGPRKQRPRGTWQNLSDELRGNPHAQSNDDFGPRTDKGW